MTPPLPPPTAQRWADGMRALRSAGSCRWWSCRLAVAASPVARCSRRWARGICACKFLYSIRQKNICFNKNKVTHLKSSRSWAPNSWFSHENIIGSPNPVSSRKSGQWEKTNRGKKVRGKADSRCPEPKPIMPSFQVNSPHILYILYPVYRLCHLGVKGRIRLHVFFAIESLAHCSLVQWKSDGGFPR